MKKLIEKILGSFTTNEGGWSARKLTAFVFCCMTIIIESTWLIAGEWVYLGEVLVINVSFISALLGLTTWEYVKKSKAESN